MNHPLSKTVHKWLTLLDIEIDARYLEYRLCSHPDFPSAAAITSLLTEFKIESTVIQIEISELLELRKPFLAVIDDTDFILIDDSSTIDQQCKNFVNRWTGFIIKIEQSSRSVHNPVIKQFKRAHSDLLLKQGLVLFLLSALTITALLNTTVYADVILFLFSITGLLLCMGIVLYELGIETFMYLKLWNINSYSNYRKPPDSVKSSLSRRIKPSDMALAFFAGCIALFILQAFGPPVLKSSIPPLMGWMIFATIPFAIYCVYKQWKIRRSWCKNCLLMIACLLCMQLIEFEYGGFKMSFDFYNLIFVVLIFVLPGSIWLLVRLLLDWVNMLKTSQLNLLKIKRSAKVFDAYLKKQMTIDNSPWSFDFQIGNPDAACQILMVSAPYCSQCAEAHQLMVELLQKHKNKVGVTIRFLIHPANHNDLNTPVQEHLLQYASTITGFFNNTSRIEKMLNDWYKIQNLDAFRELYPLTDEPMVLTAIKKQAEWINRSQLTRTPAFFVNGYQLENPYSYHDLLELAGDLSILFSEESDPSSNLKAIG